MSTVKSTSLKRNVLVDRAEEVFCQGGDIHDIISALEFHELYDVALSLFDKTGSLQQAQTEPESYLSAAELDFVWTRFDTKTGEPLRREDDNSR